MMQRKSCIKYLLIFLAIFLLILIVPNVANAVTEEKAKITSEEVQTEEVLTTGETTVSETSNSKPTEEKKESKKIVIDNEKLVMWIGVLSILVTIQFTVLLILAVLTYKRTTPTKTKKK